MTSLSATLASRVGDFVRDGPELPFAEIETAHLIEGERACPSSSEHSELMAGLVDGAVAVEAFRDGKSWRVGGVVRDPTGVVRKNSIRR